MAMKKSEIKENQFANATMPNLVVPPQAQPVQAQAPQQVVAPATTTTTTAKENTDSEKVRMSIYVKKDSKRIIEGYAKAKNTSVSQILTDILDEFAQKNQAYANEYFALQDKIKAMTAEFNNKMSQ